MIPVLFGLGAIVLDIGNWYVHKRHLQTQVDAAVLAAGPAFVGCFHAPAAANQAIAQTALEYAGDTLRDGTTVEPAGRSSRTTSGSRSTPLATGRSRTA